MRVLLITPTYFSADSIIGGGERYVTELARALTTYAEVKVISFSQNAERRSFRQHCVHYGIHPSSHFGGFNVHNPFSTRFLSKTLRPEVLHIHQVCTFVSDLACLARALCGKPVVATDHGGGGAWVLNRRLPIYPLYDAVVGQSRVALRELERDFQVPSVHIPGGIDLERFAPVEGSFPEKKILFVGRIHPHKGVHLLIETFRAADLVDFRLEIMGRTVNQEYLERLRRLADGIPVRFIHDADDAELLAAYQSACVTVLPSLSSIGSVDRHVAPELMGFTLLESQACGTPVICSSAGGMPEFVLQGKSGLVVREGSEQQLADGLRFLCRDRLNNPHRWATQCREWVGQFSWDAVARAHMSLYESFVQIGNGQRNG